MRTMAIAVLCVGLLALVPSSLAVNVTWIGPANGLWSAAGNWSGGTPTGNDTYVNGAPANQPIVLDMTDSITSLQLANGGGTTGTLNANSGFNLTVGAWSRIGNSGLGTVNQSNGTLAFNGGFALSDNSGGAGSTYNLSGGTMTTAQITVGMRGAGNCNVSAAGILNVTDLYVGSRTDDNNGCTGTVTQTGGTVNATNVRFAQNAGTTGIYHLNAGTLNISGSGINGAGTGTLNIDGGTLNLNGSAIDVDNLRLGNAASTTGAFALAAGKTLTATDLTVGNQGAGTLTQNGGTANATTLTLGSQGGSSGTYILNVGTLNLTNSLANTAGTGTLTIDGGTLAPGAGCTSIAVDTLNVGNLAGKTGAFTLNGARTLAVTDLKLGRQGTSNGTLTVADVGTTANLSSVLIAESGIGRINQTGGSVNVASYIYLANDAGGNGTYDLSGGTLTSNPGGWGMTIGMRGTGTVNVSGAGTLLNVNNGVLWVGSSAPGTAGTGTVNQNDGTVNANAGLTLANQTGSTGTYNLNGGTLNVTGNITDGSGTSTMRIDGGTLSLGGTSMAVDNLFVGYANGRTGSLTLGSGKTLAVTNLEVGENGGSTGNLNIGPGATMTVGAWSRVGAGGAGTLTQTGGFALADWGGASNSGTYNLSGGTLTTAQITVGMRGKGYFNPSGTGVANISTLYVGSRAEANVGNGTVTQTGGRVNAGTVDMAHSSGTIGTYNLQDGLLSASSIILGLGNATFNFTGGTLDADSIAMSLTNNGGILSPGDTGFIGTTTFTGSNSYTQTAAGTLHIDVNALAGTADELIVGGAANLGGTLEISLIAGSLYYGQTFDILDWGSLSGGFDRFVYTTGTYWDTSKLYLDGTIRAVPEPATLALLGLGLLLCRRRRA